MYPKGGTGILAQKLTDHIISAGGKILTQTAVNRVDTAKNEIKTANGEIFQYKKLIWGGRSKGLIIIIKRSSNAKR